MHTLFRTQLLFSFSKLLTLFLIVFFTRSPDAQAQLSSNLEQKAQELFSIVRCQVCNGQSIKDSNAEIANTIRSSIRVHLENGKSEEEIIKYLCERYGDDIILNPPFNAKSFLLWWLPFILFTLASVVLFLRYNKEKR
jgi:cytochrome c-type biogenesis protein CcmH